MINVPDFFFSFLFLPLIDFIMTRLKLWAFHNAGILLGSRCDMKIDKINKMGFCPINTHTLYFLCVIK